MKYTSTGAMVSPDRAYRYMLWREWRDPSSHDDANWVFSKAPKPKACLFIMLNPSTADASEDDATIRKCVKFAARWKFERLEVCNLFAFRATSPVNMKASVSPVGRDNDKVISERVKEAGLIVCAWGAHGRFLTRDWTVMRAHLSGREGIKCLATNNDGSPKHPLYCRDESDLRPYWFSI